MPISIAQKYFNEAETFKEKGFYSKAVESYKKSIEIDSSFTSAYYNLAILYHQTNKFDDAIAHLKIVTELDPEDASAFNNLGVIYSKNNRFEEARNYFEKALSIDTHYDEARYNLKILHHNSQKINTTPAIQQSTNTRLHNIGFVSLWFERGQAYVTKSIRDALDKIHNTFVFARNGGTSDKPMLQTTGEWNVSNLTTHPEYRIPRELLRDWVLRNNLEIVFFNEEYDMELVEVVRQCGVKTVGYYVWELFDPQFVTECNHLYNKIICPTNACYEKFRYLGMNNVENITWGVDLSQFIPKEHSENKRVRFFHPAGWGGLHARRGTQFVIDAFKILNNPDAELLIHTQHGSGIQENNNIKIIYGTVSRDEIIRMYQEADVAVLPSKWEGLGLTFLEAIGAGLPIITVDAPPMNEFVRNGETGLLCRVKERISYPGIFVEGIHVDLDHLASQMQRLIDPNIRDSMRKQTIAWRVDQWNWSKTTQILQNLTRDMIEKSQTECTETIHVHSKVQLDNQPLQLVSKNYAGCELFKKDNRQYIRKGEIVEPFTIHLVGARWSNFPWGMENEIYRALEKMGFQLIDTDFRRDFNMLPSLLKQSAHLLLVIKGNGIPPELIEQQSCLTILWYQDDIFATQHAPQQIAYNARAFDIVYSFDKNALDEYRKYAVKDPRWLPLAMSPSVHKKMYLPKTYDVSFVGNVYPNRKSLFERLQKRFNVLVTKAFMDEMVKIFNQSKIVLNLGVGPTGIQSRVFEALGCGSFLVTNEIPPDSRLFEERKHLVYFNDKNIEELIEYYLNHDEEREAVAQAGYLEVHARHTYEYRMEIILKDALTNSKVSTSTVYTDNNKIHNKYKIVFAISHDQPEIMEKAQVEINLLIKQGHTINVVDCTDAVKKTDVDVMNQLFLEHVISLQPNILLVYGGKDIYPNILRKLKNSLNLKIFSYWEPALADNSDNIPPWVISLNKDTDACFFSNVSIDNARNAEDMGLRRGFLLNSGEHIVDKLPSILNGTTDDRKLLYQDKVIELKNATSEEKLLNTSKLMLEKGLGIIAAPYLDNIIQTNAKCLDSYLLLSDHFLAQGALEKAKDILLRALNVPLQSAELDRRLGNVYFKLGDIDKAEKWLRSTLKQNCNDSNIYHCLGQIYVQKGDLAEAEKYFKTSIKECTNHITGLIHLGKLYKKQSRMAEAISCFQQCLTLDHNHEYNEDIRKNLEELYSMKEVQYDISKIQVSVILLSYNRAKYMERVLSQLSKQSFPQQAFEIIVIDSSNDNTKEVVQNAVERYGLNIRFFFIHPEGPGPNTRWFNKAVKQAQGDIILWTQPEVLFSDRMLEEFYKPHVFEKKLWVSSRMGVVVTEDEQEKIDQIWDNGIEYVLKNFNIRRESFRLGYKFWLPLLVSFRRDEFLNIGGFIEGLPVPRHDDLDLFFRLLAIGFSIHNPPGFQGIHQWHAPMEERGKDLLPIMEKTRQVVYEWRRAFLRGEISAEKYAMRNEGKEIGIVPDMREENIFEPAIAR